MDTQQILQHALTLVLGGSLGGAVAKSYIERKLPSADKILEREEKARTDFMDDLMAQVRELRGLHDQCMRDRLDDSRRVEYMRGQLELLTGTMAWTSKVPPVPPLVPTPVDKSV